MHSWTSITGFIWLNCAHQWSCSKCFHCQWTKESIIYYQRIRWNADEENAIFLFTCEMQNLGFQKKKTYEALVADYFQQLLAILPSCLSKHRKKWMCALRVLLNYFQLLSSTKSFHAKLVFSNIYRRCGRFQTLLGFFPLIVCSE